MNTLQETLEQGLAAIQSAQNQAIREYEASSSLYRADLEHHQRELTELYASQVKTLKENEVSNSVYREQAAKYEIESSGLAAGRAFAMVVRVLILLSLLYIAYRVS